MADFDVDIVIFEVLGLERLVLEVAFDGVFVKAHPSFELVVGRHGWDCLRSCWDDLVFVQLLDDRGVLRR